MKTIIMNCITVNQHQDSMPENTGHFTKNESQPSNNKNSEQFSLAGIMSRLIEDKKNKLFYDLRWKIAKEVFGEDFTQEDFERIQTYNDHAHLDGEKIGKVEFVFGSDRQDFKNNNYTIRLDFVPTSVNPLNKLRL